MTSSILNVGKSALAAAQIGLTTTGHNIANAATPGYTRQVVTQSAVAGEDNGYGFIGKGTVVSSVERMYNEYLGGQVVSAQTTSSQLNTYYTQILQINNMLADTSAGLSPALQNFFKSVQNLADDPSGSAARQSLLSTADSLVARYQSLDGQIKEIGQGINGQIESSVGMINVYAKQIANLNETIEKSVSSSGGKIPNDLLDQRDLAIAELSKEVKVTVVKQGQTYNVFMGNGQPLVVSTKASTLSTTMSPTDPNRLEVAYTHNGKTTVLAASSFSGGGSLGGLFEFRSKTLDAAQNSLGRIALVFAQTFNAQHRLGQTQTGELGEDFFTMGQPVVSPSTANLGSGAVSATIQDTSALVASDYRLQYIPASGSTPPEVKVTRLSDGRESRFSPPSAQIDGVEFSLSGSPAVGDDFLVRPTANGAANISVALTGIASIAAATPIRTAAPVTNAGTGKISTPVVTSADAMSPVKLTYNAGANTLTGFPAGQAVTVTVPGTPPTSTTYAAGTPVPYTSGATISFDGVSQKISGTLSNGATFNLKAPTATLSYDAAANTLSGFPPNMPITVEVNGVGTPYAAGAQVPYTSGAKISVGGISFSISGNPGQGDQFTLGANVNGAGDSSNALLLASLQTAKLMDNGSSTYQGSYSQLVNQVGNKTRELEATSAAADKMYTQAVNAQQAESGVNLDEEATNLIRYQQAYQAAAKVMQTAGQLFDTLLALGN